MKTMFGWSCRVVGFLALGAIAEAAITVSVVEFTPDTLTLEVQGGSANAISGPVPESSLNILDFAPGPGFFWINASVFTPSPGDLSSLPLTHLGNSISALKIYDHSAGDTVYVETTNPLEAGDYFTSNFTISWSGSGLFDVGAVGGNPLTVYWGTNAAYDAASGTFQSFAQIPEPGMMTAVFGVAALASMSLWRRRSGSKAERSGSC